MKNQIQQILNRVPDLRPHLTSKARIAFDVIPPIKSAELFNNRLEKLVEETYAGGKAEDTFVEEMALLIAAYLLLAYRSAWQDNGGGNKLPDYLDIAYRAAVLEQYVYIEQYHDDIITARTNQTPIDPLLARTQLWATRYEEQYNNANILMAKEEGVNLVWKYGDTDHCDTCRKLDGIVASENDWRTVGVVPQAAPNPKLDCEGWRCQCTLSITTQKRSKNALNRITEAVYG